MKSASWNLQKTLCTFVNSSYRALHSYHQLCAISSNIFSCLMYHFDSQCPCVKTWFLFSDLNLALKRSKTHKHHTSEHRTNAGACNVIPVWIAMETYQNVAECLCLGALCVFVCVCVLWYWSLKELIWVLNPQSEGVFELRSSWLLITCGERLVGLESGSHD